MFVEFRSTALLLLFWIFVAIIPAAVARETPHALRIENSLPVWQIFIAYGIATLFSLSSRPTSRDPVKEEWIPGQARNDNNRRRIIMMSLCGLIYALSFSYFWHNYMNHYPTEYSGEWQYGYREAIQFVSPVRNSYKSIVMTESIGRPYMYVLFYEQYDPSAARQDIKGTFDAAGFYNVTALGKYRFVREGIGELEKGVLYILPPNQVPTAAHILKTVTLLNGVPVLVIFDT